MDSTHFHQASNPLYYIYLFMNNMEMDSLKEGIAFDT